MDNCIACGATQDENDFGVYKFSCVLENGWELSILTHCAHNQRYTYSYTYKQFPNMSDGVHVRLKEPDIINKMEVIVDYQNGVISRLVITMDLLFPKRRGKKKFVGVDISEGSHLFITLEYIHEYRKLTLNKLTKGCSDVLTKIEDIDWSRYDKGLFIREKQFPVEQNIVCSNGMCFVRYLANDREKSILEIPISILIK